MFCSLSLLDWSFTRFKYALTNPFLITMKHTSLGDIVRNIMVGGSIALAPLASAQEGFRADQHLEAPPQEAYLEHGEFARFYGNGIEGLMLGTDDGAFFAAPDVSEYLSIPAGSGIRILGPEGDYPLFSNISPEGRVSYLVAVPMDVESITIRQGEDSGPTMTPYWGVDDALGSSAIFYENGEPAGWLAFVSLNVEGSTQNYLDVTYREEK